MKKFLRHLFLPHHSNNHRAKFLHHDSILFLIALLLVGQLFVSIFKTQFSSVLGIAFDIRSEELLTLTNSLREKDGNNPLTLNDQLSEAALLKAKDMFAKNYWAHNAPDGTTPWFFFKKINYDYVYAGENLARGFRNSKDIVDAWMASSSHRENMLSKNYDEVGFAILEGNLLGEDTILVVEMLGNKDLKTFAKESNKNDSLELVTTSSPSAYSPSSKSLGKSEKLPVLSFNKKPLIDSSALSFNISKFILILFISLLILDIIIVERKKIQRVHGHNLDHVLYFTILLIITFIVGKGIIL